MMSQLFTTAWSLYFTCITWLHSTVPGRIFTQGIQQSVLVSRRPQSKMIAASSEEFPLVWHFPDQLLVCLRDNHDPGWTWLPEWQLLVSIFPSVRPGLCDSRKGSSSALCWAMVNGTEPTLLKFLPWFGRNRWEAAGWASWATTLNPWGPGWFHPVSKLCGLPAHLPRNLASFSPCVDDRNRGGSGPRWLIHHRWFLSYRRGGVRVLIVHFDGGRQRSYWRTCGRKGMNCRSLNKLKDKSRNVLF